MRKFYYQFLDLILFSNLFMALCTVAQALVTFKLIGCAPYYPLLALLFSSTLFIYNICLFLTKPANPDKSPLLPKRWFFAHPRLMTTLTLISAMVLLFMYLLLTFKSEVLLVGLGVLSVGYSLPIFSKNGQRYGLRNIPGIKSILIALVWTMSCVMLPIFEAERTHHIVVSNSDIALLITKRFLFIVALTIPFDIRDLFHDSQGGLKTIPVMFGEKGAYLFCQVLLIVHLILLFLFKNGFDLDFLALGLTTLLMGWLIFKSKWEKNEYYYFFYMDGVLILQYVLLMAFTFI
ncbi:MAG: UbiA family prenyltransferase [Mucilaginibacter sp.]|uniref:UbiA family prenyltransferase n=1 Tax=Mucilaginibacter sp. TaxID=1882438 RepID=UPI00326798F7